MSDSLMGAPPGQLNALGSLSVDKLGSVRSNRLLRLGLSFFLFGCINNVLYVIILSAALDLVPPSTPKGIIAFCNIAPALVAKVGWPYILKGSVRYNRRIIGCCACSIFGMFLVAAYDSLFMRLLGIGFASFSSGLGELTFLQLSTTYSPSSVSGKSVGYFASGTGAAGLVGAFLWWELRGLGVRTGIGLSSILPLVTPLAYRFLLPAQTDFLGFAPDSPLESSYTPLPNSDPGVSSVADEDTDPLPLQKHRYLSWEDKWTLVKPMLTKYMLPLFCVYLLEYTINQGIAPTLLYAVPVQAEHPIFGAIFHSVRDYYPFWQLVYQATVFLSRSSISMGLPPLPARLLPLPAVVQACILTLLALESATGFLSMPSGSDGYEAWTVFVVFVMIAIEGVCGGLAYVNVFYRVNQEAPNSTLSGTYDAEQLKQESEFKIGSIGFADSSGILLASILAMPTEVMLCNAQVNRGKMLCKGL